MESSDSPTTANTSSNPTTSNNAHQSMHFTWLSPSMRRFVLRSLNVPTAADALPTALHVLVTSGKHSFLTVPLLELVVCALWLPFYLLAYLITERGVYALLIGTVVFLGRVVLRLLAFPGASQRVSGEIEREFAKYSFRMLQAALSAVIDLASAILALEGGSTGGSNTTTTTNNNNAACSEIANSWKRVQSYRNRVMGLYYPVLAYIYEEPPVPSVNPVNNINSNNANTNSQLNAFGNNKLSGDVGNLSGITMEAQVEGRRFMGLLGKVLSDITSLEQNGSILLNNNGRFIPHDAINETVKHAAQTVLHSAGELKLLLLGMAQTVGDTTTDDDDDEIEDVTMDSVRRHLGENGGGSAWDAISTAFAAILPMLDPAPHKSIFGLDVLRGTVLSRYRGATQMWFRRPTGGQIDSFHIPAQGRDPAQGRNQKAVLYCNPNAGLIEVATGMSLVAGNCSKAMDASDEACWTDYYIQKGYDIYLFNYAGYGRSYGTASAGNKARTAGCLGACGRILYSAFFAFTPTPDSVRADAIAVGSYLITELGVESLIIHGESIGGVAAAGAARVLTNTPSTKDKVALLICDRTFTNLQAIAQRLVGSWTAPAISALAPMWNTDVAADFLAATCPKVLAQDHADAIIADTGSLKSGISLWKEIRRQTSTKGVGWAMEAPFEYRTADWENVGVLESRLAPTTAAHIQPPAWPTDKHITLRAGFHFAACARRIGKLSTQERRTNRSRSNTADVEEGVELDYDGTTGSSQSSESLSGLVAAWKSLACCDGLCGAPLGAAVKQGYDWTLIWLCCTLTFGGQMVAASAETRQGSSDILQISPLDFDCRPPDYQKEENEIMVHPIPMPEVISILRSLVDINDVSIRSAEHEILYCIGVLEYIVARLSAPVTVDASKQGLHMQDQSGHLLNLHCGHNSQFSVEERVKLSALLVEVERRRR